MSGYVGDGYDLDGYVQAAPEAKSGERLYEALEFTYRPAVRREVIKHDAEVQIALRDELTDPEAAVKAEMLACKFVASKLKTWNLKDRNGNAVPITDDACSRLNSQLFTSVYFIIRGSRVADKKPEAKEPALNDTAMVGN